MNTPETCIVVGLIALPVATFVATYLLLPWPLLSYPQSDLQTEHGEVSKVRKIRPRIFEVSLKKNLGIGSCAVNLALSGGSITTYVHFRRGQTLPRIGDKIMVTSVNRLHRFTGKSFNWVRDWNNVFGPIPVGGVVTLIDGEEIPEAGAA